MAFEFAIITNSGKNSLKKFKNNKSTIERFKSLVEIAKQCVEGKVIKLSHLSKLFPDFKDMLWRVKKKGLQERIIFVHNEKTNVGFLVYFFLRGKVGGNENQEYMKLAKKSDIAQAKNYNNLANDPRNEVFEDYIITIK
jgi:hypothetical protein